jgi:hypothetical protein
MMKRLILAIALALTALVAYATTLSGTSGTLSADGTYTMPSAIKNPTYQLTGGTWGSGTVVVKANGVAIAGASYTAAMSAPVQFQAERAVQLEFVLTGSTGPSIGWAVW